MKKLGLALFVLLFSTALFAEDAESTSTPPVRDTYYTSGYYMGLNLGQSDFNADEPGYDSTNKGFAFRTYMGYQFSPYATAEIGYVYLPAIKYSSPTAAPSRINTYVFDLLIGGKFPIGEGFSIYGKIGPALANSKLSVKSQSQTESATVLAYAGGIDYAFANIGGLHMILDYYHNEQKNTNTFAIPSLNFYSVGVYYLF